MTDLGFHRELHTPATHKRLVEASEEYMGIKSSGFHERAALIGIFRKLKVNRRLERNCTTSSHVHLETYSPATFTYKLVAGLGSP